MHETAFSFKVLLTHHSALISVCRSLLLQVKAFVSFHSWVLVAFCGKGSGRGEEGIGCCGGCGGAAGTDILKGYDLVLHAAQTAELQPG